MSRINNFLDGRSFLDGSPFRSTYFIIASAAGVGSVVLVVYLLLAHWRTLTTYPILFLSVLVGLQMIYQWLRVLRYRSKMREFCSEASVEDVTEGSPLYLAVRVAAGGLIDVLFFSYSIALAALVLVAFLLSRLDGPR